MELPAGVPTPPMSAAIGIPIITARPKRDPGRSPSLSRMPCHGPTGEEGPSIALVGGDVTTRTNHWPIRHWPFAPSMPRRDDYVMPGTWTPETRRGFRIEPDR